MHTPRAQHSRHNTHLSSHCEKHTQMSSQDVPASRLRQSSHILRIGMLGSNARDGSCAPVSGDVE